MSLLSLIETPSLGLIIMSWYYELLILIGLVMLVSALVIKKKQQG